jgi:hypothetical protein
MIKLLISDLDFSDYEIQTNHKIAGGIIQAPQFTHAVSTSLSTAVNLKTNISSGGADYAYSVAAGAGGAVAFSINGQAQAIVITQAYAL